MKNKFNTNKNKKNNSNNEIGMASSHNSSSLDHISSQGNDDNCKRCNELINLLKNTRFVARWTEIEWNTFPYYIDYYHAN